MFKLFSSVTAFLKREPTEKSLISPSGKSSFADVKAFFSDQNDDDLIRIITSIREFVPSVENIAVIDLLIDRRPQLDWWPKVFTYIYASAARAQFIRSCQMVGFATNAEALGKYSFGYYADAIWAWNRVGILDDGPMRKLYDECSASVKVMSNIRAMAAPDLGRKPPFIIIHNGNQDYVACCLAQLIKLNGDGNVVLIGDGSPSGVAGVIEVRTSDYSEDANKFAAIYRHHATTPHDYERFCFQRWLILNEYMQANGHESAVLIDSDILAFVDAEKMIADLGRFEMSNWAWTCPVKDRSILQGFVCYLLNIYEMEDDALHDFIRSYGRVVGNDGRSFQDMHALYTFARVNRHQVANYMTAPCAKGYDINMIVDQGYELEILKAGSQYVSGLPVKKVRWKDGVPRFIDKETKMPVPARTMHFQGASKVVMPLYMEQPN